MDIDKINNSSIRLSQIYAILSYLNQHSNVKKEDLYSNIGGSRQTKIKILQEVKELGWVEQLSKVGPHNTQTIVITDAGKLQLSVMDGTYNSFDNNQSLEIKPADLSKKINLEKIRNKIQLSLDYLCEDNPEIDFVIKVLKDALIEINSYEPKSA